MANNLDNQVKVLREAERELDAYAKVFNTTAESVISNTEAMGVSALELKDQLNKLLSDAKGLSDLGKSLNLNDQGQIDGYVAKIKGLSKELSDLTPKIHANMVSINEAFQKEFKLDDGSTGYIKEQLNELRSLFSEDFLKGDVKTFAPDLSAWTDSFIDQVNKIEWAMGRLTEFGKQRSETEKALGFVVEQKDVTPIIEAKKQELDDYGKLALDYGYSGVNSQFLADFPEVARDIESINTYITQLENSIGKKIQGYIDLFNQANNLVKAGDSHRELYETIGSPMMRSMYSPDTDWNSMTPSGLRKLNGELDDEIGGSDWEEFSGSSKKAADSVSEVKSAVDKTAQSVIKYSDELDKLVNADNVLSQEQKQGVLSQDYSAKIKRYADDVSYARNELQALGNTKLTPMPETKLDLNKSEDAMQLSAYKARINEALESVSRLKEETNLAFSQINNPSEIGKFRGIDKDTFSEIKRVIENGYSVNLLDGSADKEKLDELKKEFLQIVESMKSFNIDVVPDKEIEDMAKLEAMQKAINAEKKRQSDEAMALAQYEQDKVKYAEQYLKIAQAQANIKALEANRESLMANADTKKDKVKTITDPSGKTKEVRYSDRDAIAERYAREISTNNRIIQDAEKTVNQLKQKFTQYKLEIPVTPVVKAKANLEGDFRKESIALISGKRNEILGGLRGQDEVIKKLNQEASNLGLNVDKANSRLSAIGNTIKTAFYSGDIERARSLMGAYASEVDKLRTKIEGQSKAQDISRERQRQAQAEAEKTARARQKAADENQRASEKEKKAYEDSLNAAKSKVQGVLSTIKSLADGVNNGVNKIVSIIRQGMNLITRIVSGGIKFIGSIGSTVTNIIKLFGNLGNRIRQAFSGGSGSANIFKNSITELNSKLALLKNAFNAIFNNQFINKGKNLLTSISTLNVVIGNELTDNTIEWAESLERALGVSATDLIADLKEISAVLKGLGMSSEDVYVGARNLGMMSRYLGMMGLAGGDVDQVMSKLTSGMKGMTAAIDDLGLSVRDAEMNSYLKELQKQGGEFANIATDFSSLNEEARVYVRYSSLISQFTKSYDLSNFADQLNTSTGRLSILSQTWSSLATTIGVAFTKVGAYLAGFLIPLIKRLETYVKSALVSIQAFLNRVGAFFNINLDLGLDDVLSSTANQIDSSGIDGINNKLSETNEELEKVEENAKKASGGLQSFDRVNNVTSSKDSGTSGESDFDYSILMNSALESLDAYAAEAENYFEKLDKNLTTTIDNIKNKLIEMIGEDRVKRAIELYEELGEKIKQAFRFLTGQQTLDDVITMNTDTTGWGDFLKLLDNMPQKLRKVLEMIGELFSVLSGKPNMNAISEIQSESTWGNVLSIISSLRDILGQLINKLVEFTSNELLPWIVEKLSELADWLVENKDRIVDLLSKVASIAWDGFKLFVELVGNLVDYVVKNPGAVVGFFSALLGLKVASWFTSVAASIGMAVVGLEGFTKLIGSGGLLAKLGTLLGVGGASTGAGATASGGAAATGGILGGISAGPIVAIIAVIVALTAAIVDLWNTSEDFRNAVGNAWDTIKEKLSGAFERIGEAFENIKTAWSNFYDSYESSGLKELLEVVLITNLEMSVNFIVMLIDVIGSLLTGIANIFADLINMISGVVDVVSGVVKIIIGLFVGLFTGDWEMVKEGASQAVTGLVEILGGIIQGFIDLIKGLGDVLFDIGNYLTGGLLEGIKSSFDSVMSGIRTWIDNFIAGVKEKFGIHSPSKVFAEIGTFLIQGLINGISGMLGQLGSAGGKIVSSLQNGITNAWSTLTNKVSSLTTNLVSGIKNGISTGWDNITGWLDNVGSTISNGWNYVTGKTSATSGRRITTNANGGSIAGGQLFIANENGNAELIGNIDGSGKTNVANNNMIVTAMKSGVFEAVYNAMAEVQNQRGTTGNVGQANIKIDGFGLIDQSTLRELARLLAPYLNSNNVNIANTNFSI